MKTESSTSPTPHRPLRSALIGAGRITAYHVAALREIPGVEIVGLCDLNEATARQKAAQFGIPHAFNDAESMMREAKPDVVHIITPPRPHLRLAEIVAGHGAHLYVEKPLASTEAEARSMVEVAERAGVRLCPGHNRLFDPHFVELVRSVRAGQIGRVVSVRAEQGFAYEKSARSASIPWSYTYDWGIFENLIPHPLYLATHFLKATGDPQVVGFNLGSVREAGVEEIHVMVPAETAVAEVVLSLNCAPVRNYVEVIGTEGRIMADYVSLATLRTLKSPMPAFVSRFTTNFSTAAQLTGATLGMGIGVVTGRVKQYMGLRALVAEFYRSLREGTAPPVLPEHGILNVRQMDQIKLACEARLKKRVSVATTGPVLAARVLVTGASGFLGGRVVERLAADGIPVRATTRLMSRVEARPGVHWVPCDITKEDDLKRSLEGIETVYHCAAMAGPPGSLEEYEDINVRSSVRLATLAAEAGVKNLVYISSISVYEMPHGTGPYLDETAPYERRAADRGFYTQSKLAADRALREYSAQHASPRIILLRPGTIYGPGVKLPVGRFQLPSPAERPLVAGGRGVPMTLTYVDNVVDAMLLASASRVPTGRIFNVIDDPNVDQGAVARTLREVTGGRVRPRFIPYVVVWMMMLAVDLVSLLRRHKMGTARYRLKRTLANMRYPSRAAREELGWSPNVSLAEGIKRVLTAETNAPFR